MRLLNDFFHVVKMTSGELAFSCTIKLNPGHIVYTGHFPGYPVTPGVIQLQIVHELLENYFCKNLRLITISQSKFLKILNPNETLQLLVHIEFNRTGDELIIKARGEKDADIFFKLQSTYRFTG